MTGPTELAGEQAQAQVRAVKETAEALGLTWSLRPATVVATTGDQPMAVLDGDTVAIAVTSMVGTLREGQRVYVMAVPPGGNFAAGRVNAPFSQRQTLASSASSVIFSVPQTVGFVRCSWTARCDAASQIIVLYGRINASSAGAYSYQWSQGNNNTNSAAVGTATTQWEVGLVTGASAAAGRFGSGTVDISSWDQGVGSLSHTFSSQALGDGAANFYHRTGGGIYTGAAPYSTFTLVPQAGNFIAGSDFLIEGV